MKINKGLAAEQCALRFMKGREQEWDFRRGCNLERGVGWGEANDNKQTQQHKREKEKSSKST